MGHKWRWVGLGVVGCLVRLGRAKLGWVSGFGANATNLGGWPYELVRASKVALGCLLFLSFVLFCFPSYMMRILFLLEVPGEKGREFVMKEGQVGLASSDVVMKKVMGWQVSCGVSCPCYQNPQLSVWKTGS